MTIFTTFADVYLVQGFHTSAVTVSSGSGLLV